MTLENLFCAVIIATHFFLLFSMWVRMEKIEEHLVNLTMLITEYVDEEDEF